jgi:hypothetical protein
MPTICPQLQTSAVISGNELSLLEAAFPSAAGLSEEFNPDRGSALIYRICRWLSLVVPHAGRTTVRVDCATDRAQDCAFAVAASTLAASDRVAVVNAGLHGARGFGTVSAKPLVARRHSYRGADPLLRTRLPRCAAACGRQEARQHPNWRGLAVRATLLALRRSVTHANSHISCQTRSPAVPYSAYDAPHGIHAAHKRRRVSVGPCSNIA